MINIVCLVPAFILLPDVSHSNDERSLNVDVV